MMKRFFALRRRGPARLRSVGVALVIAGAVALGAGGVAQAASGAAIVVDAKSGKVLFSDNPDTRRYPASLTKMMTLYLLFEQLDSGKTSLSSRIPISDHAAAQAPSKLGLKPGSTISVRDAICAIVTRSANDIAVAIAEYVGGSEDAFANKMTAKAHELGMARTTFQNASGLPDPGQMTTARDMATLGRALEDRFPGYFKFFATPSFVFNGHRIPGHNRLLGRVPGVNGIKTGYTRAAGYNLVTSVNRGNRQLVAVVLGGTSGRARDQKMVNLIETYIPRASDGARTAPLVASATPAEKASEQVAVAQIPAPRLKPDFSEAEPVEPGQTGSISVASVDVVPAPDGTSDEGDGGDDAVAGDQPAVAQPAPAKAAPMASGWKIQIAAAPSESSAHAQLKKARATAPKLLASASEYLEPVVSGKSTLYRARFTGFASKESARAACTYLAKQNISCLALQ